MKTPSDGWDQDERDVLELEGVRRELDALRARHALSPEDESRLLGRIQQLARSSTPARAGGFWRWGLPLAAAAGVLLVVFVWTRRPDGGASIGGTARSEPRVPTTPAPVFQLALDKPDIKVSPSALAWRGPRGENTLLADLKPAFDAYRADDFQRADREFSALSAKYPQAIEIALYQGVVRLFLGNSQGAIASLTAAELLPDKSLSWEVAWYRAVADERAGNLSDVRTRLTGLCAQPDRRARIACDALKRLPGGGAQAP